MKSRIGYCARDVEILFVYCIFLFIFSGTPLVLSLGSFWTFSNLKAILRVRSRDNLTIVPRTIFLKNPEDLIPAEIDGSGDSEKFYLKRRGGKAKGKRQNVGLSMGGGVVILYEGFSGDSSWCSIGKKFLMCLYFLC